MRLQFHFKLQRRPIFLARRCLCCIYPGFSRCVHISNLTSSKSLCSCIRYVETIVIAQIKNYESDYYFSKHFCYCHLIMIGVRQLKLLMFGQIQQKASNTVDKFSLNCTLRYTHYATKYILFIISNLDAVQIEKYGKFYRNFQGRFQFIMLLIFYVYVIITIFYVLATHVHTICHCDFPQGHHGSLHSYLCTLHFFHIFEPHFHTC